MSQLAWAVRIGGFGMLTRLGGQLGSQQVARRNAAMAAAALLRRREEREAVDAYVAARLDVQLRPATRGPSARPAAGAGTAS
jgi:hypothetical protein